jgi:hypothetical protein
MTQQRTGNAKSVVHAAVGREAYQILQAYPDGRGFNLTQALRDLLEDLKQRLLEEVDASRLESILRALASIAEQHARLASRIEANVAILRSVEQGGCI